MKTYLLEPRDIAHYRCRREVIKKDEGLAPVRVLAFTEATSELVSQIVHSNCACFIVRPKKFTVGDMQALVALFGHLGKISPVIKYGSQVAVVIHRCSFGFHHSQRFAIRYPIGSIITPGTEISDVFLKFKDAEFTGFHYRVNHAMVPVDEARLVYLEGKNSQ